MKMKRCPFVNCSKALSEVFGVRRNAPMKLMFGYTDLLTSTMMGDFLLQEESLVR